MHHHRFRGLIFMHTFLWIDKRMEIKSHHCWFLRNLIKMLCLCMYMCINCMYQMNVLVNFIVISVLFTLL